MSLPLNRTVVLSGLQDSSFKENPTRFATPTFAFRVAVAAARGSVYKLVCCKVGNASEIRAIRSAES